MAFLKAHGIDLNRQGTVNWQVAHKALLDYARQSGAAASSDAQLNAALGSNASTDIDKDAAIHVVQQEIGRQRQRIAAVGEHGDRTGKGYGDHAARFANETDPRAFAVDTYTPEERRALGAELAKNPDAKAKFERSLAIARKHRLIPDRPGT